MSVSAPDQDEQRTARERPSASPEEVRVALWGDDAPLVAAAVAALHGHHPERGGLEREQAAFAVIQAVKRVLRRPPRSEHEPPTWFREGR